MSGLLDEVRAYTAPRSRCSVSVVLASLDEQDAADLAVAVVDQSIPGTAIEQALNRRGVRLRSQSVLRHRRGACTCQP